MVTTVLCLQCVRYVLQTILVCRDCAAPAVFEQISLSHCWLCTTITHCNLLRHIHVADVDLCVCLHTYALCNIAVL